MIIDRGLYYVVQCSASKVHQEEGGGSLAAKNPGTEHSDVAFSSLLLPTAPAATADDGHNKNSASDLVAKVSLKCMPLLGQTQRGFHQDHKRC